MNEEKAPWLAKLSDLRRVIQRREQAAAYKASSPKPNSYYERQEKVVNGDVKWKPIDRVAAVVTSPATGLNRPDVYSVRVPPIQDQQPKNRKRKPKMMEIERLPSSQHSEASAAKPGNTFVSDDGIRITIGKDGQPLFNAEDVDRFMCEEITRLANETRPTVQAARDARKIVTELTEGLGAEMSKFRDDCKRYTDDIRGSRFAIVSETKQMTTSLKEVRQFFLGGDYREEIARLREFVDLCERLNKLKESGFLDRVADTMLSLAITSTVSASAGKP